MNKPENRFELTLACYAQEYGQFSSIDKIVGNSLIEILAQLPLVISRLMTQIANDGTINDHDIPF